MAKYLFTFLFIFLLSFAGIIAATQKHDKHRHSGFSEAECPGACTYRCSKTAYKKPCMFFCQKCCFKCRCVPPGTYGNKQVCPCYNNWKTKRGGPKCP
ncbi:unnamed protein product [Coffea canephora]|uniref:Gibberellin-regulated protein 6 n=1 Tax=Coffea canephora TaxID=49390 RepID=A0A068VHI7_COFCA|nr:protein GAST1-like [Coffea arabica]XP_027185447.1 protein GAST1-like [Coffea eugenioides]CDP19133.1 unnamed protein product [Coffea canephora]